MVRLQKPKVLFIDAHDSFSNNIVSLLEIRLNVEVTKIYHNAEVSDLKQLLQPYAAVVAGPGPGSALNPKDVGLIEQLWRLPEADLVPVLGICLGFQSLALALGGSIEPLPFPRHGVATTITTNEASIFAGLPDLHAVQYHSLHATLAPRERHASRDDASWWTTDPSSPCLVPLAWDFDRQWEHEVGLRQAKNPTGILMGARHTIKPFYGVQFHPESICSGAEAQKVVSNWWEEAMSWLRLNKPSSLSELASNTPRPRGSPSAPWNSSVSDGMESVLSTPPTSRSTSDTSLSSAISTNEDEMQGQSAYQRNLRCLPYDHLTVPAIVEALGMSDQDTIILDSERRQMPDIGAHSIIGLVEADSTKISYEIGSPSVSIERKGQIKREPFDDRGVFHFLKSFLVARSIPAGDLRAPFWGGLMGYITYEAGLETLGIRSEDPAQRPSICFAHVQRSIVINHSTKHILIQSTVDSDDSWSGSVLKTLQELECDSQTSIQGGSGQPMGSPAVSIQMPEQESYEAKVQVCQDEIRAGNSYELCLTTQARVTTPKHTDAWALYKRQRLLNPAPFGAYLRLGPLTLLSTSPERFLRWSRPAPSPSHRGATSTCQFRPIKGTVQKYPPRADGRPHRVSRAEAAARLATPKERAENLMIVDLIRHDLHGVAGPGRVAVPQLMRVEEYASVYQLVSVVEGTLRVPAPGRAPGSARREPRDAARPSGTKDPAADAPHGIDVLAASLPPGSMTGAPKQRACALLRRIEDRQPRSVYAGVVGYLCAGGGGDFSVVIRSAFRWDDPAAEADEWRVGAGGAVTGLSSPRGEWEEMRTKLGSVMGLFGQGDGAVE